MSRIFINIYLTFTKPSQTVTKLMKLCMEVLIWSPASPCQAPSRLVTLSVEKLIQPLLKPSQTITGILSQLPLQSNQTTTRLIQNTTLRSTDTTSPKPRQTITHVLPNYDQAHNTTLGNTITISSQVFTANVGV